MSLCIVLLPWLADNHWLIIQQLTPEICRICGERLNSNPGMDKTDCCFFFTLLSARKHTKQDSNLNEEWKSMFGSLDPPSSTPTLPTVPTVLLASGGGEPNGTLAGGRLRSESSSQTLNLPHVPSSAQVDCWADYTLSLSASLLSTLHLLITLSSLLLIHVLVFFPFSINMRPSWLISFSHVS